MVYRGDTRRLIIQDDDDMIDANPILIPHDDNDITQPTAAATIHTTYLPIKIDDGEWRSEP